MDRRALALLLPLATGALLAAPATRVAADPPAAAPAPTPAPALATDEQANAAIATWKEDFKAKGLKGDDKLSQKDFALKALAKWQHPLVVEALASASRDMDATVRMLGVIYLGDQRALPGLAGKRVAEAYVRAAGDDALKMTCLQQVGRLVYLGAREPIRDGLKSQSFAMKKAALAAAGKTGDLRLLPDVMAVIGVEMPNEGAPNPASESKSGGKEVVSEGYSWEGAEASVDTGTSGDGDQKAAEAQAKAQADANKAAAQKSAGGAGNTPGGGGDGPQGGRGGGGRSVKELVPNVLAAVKGMTGRSFANAGELKQWWYTERKTIQEKTKALDEQEKAQKAAAK